MQFLFRYRDLIAPTIAEHKAVIDKKRSCWWGWWKRPSEDARRDVWDKLIAEVAKGVPVSVGLFDSGSDSVRTALIIEVIPPTPNLDVPELPAGQEDWVPEYYRKSPFSRAWMRMTSIGEPIRFFGQYSFDGVPALPHYTPVALGRLKDKIIIDAAELRGMDTTIWEIRPRRDGDREEKILFNVVGLTQPISREPVLAAASRILHITDPHFASAPNRGQHVWRLESEKGEKPTLVEAINSALPGPIGLVVVTGDLTFVAKPEEFREAANSLRRLLGICDLDVNRLVVIPGNHDIKWTKLDAYSDTAKVDVIPEDAKVAYKQFYRDLFLHPPMETLAMGRRFLLPCGLTVEVCALNSSSLETGKNFLAGMGRVQEHAMAEVIKGLGWEDRKSLALRILALHHHVTLTEDLEPAAGYYQGFGIAVDAPRIQRMAARYGVQLCLHGHKHRAFIWRSSVYELPEHASVTSRLGDLSIVGGGSAGSSDTEGSRNFFNIIELTSTQLLVKMYRATNAGVFELMATRAAGFQLGGNRSSLQLSDWIEG